MNIKRKSMVFGIIVNKNFHDLFKMEIPIFVSSLEMRKSVYDN